MEIGTGDASKKRLLATTKTASRRSSRCISGSNERRPFQAGTGSIERHYCYLKRTVCLLQAREGFAGLTARLVDQTLDAVPNSGRKPILGGNVRHEILYERQRSLG